MSRIGSFVKTTLIGGLLVLIPIGVILALAIRMVITVRDQLMPAMSRLPYGSTFPAILAVLLCIAACFVTGLVVRTRIGNRLGVALERGLLNRLPGYVLLKNMSQRVVGHTEGVVLATALFEMEDGLVPAFIMDEHPNGTLTVFVPSVPTPAVGSMFIVPRARVHRIDVPMTKMVQCISQWGAGSGELVQAMLSRSPEAGSS